MANPHVTVPNQHRHSDKWLFIHDNIVLNHHRPHQSILLIISFIVPTDHYHGAQSSVLCSHERGSDGDKSPSPRRNIFDPVAASYSKTLTLVSNSYQKALVNVRWFLIIKAQQKWSLCSARIIRFSVLSTSAHCKMAHRYHIKMVTCFAAAAWLELGLA